MTTTSLCDCLSSVQPVELVGMRLLKAHPAPSLLPVLPRETLVEAVTEIVAYTNACAATVKRLTNLAPIPLLIPIPEFGL